MNKEKKKQLIKDFATAINMASAENESNTPDFILAEYLVMCLETFNQSAKMRDDWYDVHLEPANSHFIFSGKRNGDKLKYLNGINTETEEGKMLMAAVIKIALESQTDKTPYEILGQIARLKDWGEIA